MSIFVVTVTIIGIKMKEIKINKELLERLDVVTHQLEKISEALTSHSEEKHSRIICSKCGSACPTGKRVKYYRKEERELAEWRCISCSLPRSNS